MCLTCLALLHCFSQNHVNPAVDFTQIPPGMLALDNMLYFARHHQDAYIRVSTHTTRVFQWCCISPSNLNVLPELLHSAPWLFCSFWLFLSFLQLNCIS